MKTAIVFEETDVEQVMLCRSKGMIPRCGINVHNPSELSLRAFRALCHDAEKEIVMGTVFQFHRAGKLMKKFPDTLYLTVDEREILMDAVQAITSIRQDRHPWTEDVHEEYMGMRIVVCPDAETKRREMIES